jgi:hypothetical protein
MPQSFARWNGELFGRRLGCDVSGKRLACAVAPSVTPNERLADAQAFCAHFFTTVPHSSISLP